MRAKIIEANYAGDIGYRAIIDSNGNLHIAQAQTNCMIGGGITHRTKPNSDRAVTIPAKRAKPIIDELQSVADSIYGADEINAVHHWILARGFEALL